MSLAAAFSCEHELFFYVAETKRVNIANKVGNFKVGETISNGAGWSAKMSRRTSPWLRASPSTPRFR